MSKLISYLQLMRVKNRIRRLPLRAICIVLALALAVWGGAGYSGYATIVLASSGLALCLFYLLWDWAAQPGEKGRRTGRMVAATLVSILVGAVYGYRFWPDAAVARQRERAQVLVGEIQFQKDVNQGLPIQAAFTNGGRESASNVSIARAALETKYPFSTSDLDRLFAQLEAGTKQPVASRLQPRESKSMTILMPAVRSSDLSNGQGVYLLMVLAYSDSHGQRYTEYCELFKSPGAGAECPIHNGILDAQQQVAP